MNPWDGQLEKGTTRLVALLKTQLSFLGLEFAFFLWGQSTPQKKAALRSIFLEIEITKTDHSKSEFSFLLDTHSNKRL